MKMDKNTVIKRLREFYSLKEMLGQKNVQEFMARELKDNKYGYAAILSALQEYVREFAEIKITADETIEKYVARHVRSFKKTAAFDPAKFVVNPTKPGYEEFLMAAFDWNGKGAENIEAISAAVDANPEASEIMSKLPLLSGGKTKKSHTMLLVDNISSIATVSGLRGNVSELTTKNEKLLERIDRMQLRLSDALSEIQTLTDLNKLNVKAIEKVNETMNNGFIALSANVHAEAYLTREHLDHSIGTAAGHVIGEVRRGNEEVIREIQEGNQEVISRVLTAISGSVKSGVNTAGKIARKVVHGVGTFLTGAGFTAFVLAKLLTSTPDVAPVDFTAYNDANTNYGIYATAEDLERDEFYSIINQFKFTTESLTAEEVQNYRQNGLWTTPAGATSSYENISDEELQIAQDLMTTYKQTDRTDVVSVQAGEQTFTFNYGDASSTPEIQAAYYEAVSERLSLDKAALMATISSLQAEVDDLTTQLGQMGDADLKAKIEELKGTIAQKESEIASLQTALDEAVAKGTVSEQEKAALQAKLDESEAKVTDLEARVAALQAENGNLQSQITALNETVNSLNEQIKELQNADTVNQETITSLRATIATLEEAKATLEARLEDALENGGASNAELVQLQKTLAETEKALEEANKTIDSLTKENSGLKDENAELKGELAELESVVTALRGEVSKLNGTIDSLRAENSNLASDFAGAVEDLEKLTDIYNQLVEDYKAVGEENAALEREITEVREQLVASNQKINDLMKDANFVKSMYESILGDTSGKTQDQLRRELCEALGYNYESSTGPSLGDE